MAASRRLGRAPHPTDRRSQGRRRSRHHHRRRGRRRSRSRRQRRCPRCSLCWLELGPLASLLLESGYMRPAGVFNSYSAAVERVSLGRHFWHVSAGEMFHPGYRWHPRQRSSSYCANSPTPRPCGGAPRPTSAGTPKSRCQAGGIKNTRSSRRAAAPCISGRWATRTSPSIKIRPGAAHILRGRPGSGAPGPGTDTAQTILRGVCCGKLCDSSWPLFAWFVGRPERLDLIRFSGFVRMPLTHFLLSESGMGWIKSSFIYALVHKTSACG